MIGDQVLRARSARRRGEVVAHWAIDSKVPGRQQGYQPRGTRGRAATAGAHLLAMGAAIGSPRGHNVGRADELPWLLFAGGGHLAEPVAGVVSRNWSDEADGTDAPIVPTRAVWLPWRDVADRGELPTYSGLFRSVCRLEWPGVNDGPIGAREYRVAIPDPASDPAEVLADIDQLGTDFVAEVAGRIAAGEQVVIVLSGATELGLDLRVRVIDAVAALLPARARNCLVAATWADYRHTHFAQLSFAAAARAGQSEVHWPERRVHPPLPVVGRYLAEVRSLLAEQHPIADLARRLARSSEPLVVIGDITTAVPARMRLPRVVNDEIRAGTATVPRVRESLTEIAARGPESAAARYREAAARYLADRACDADAAVAATAAEAMSALWDDRFGALLGARCRTEPGATQARIWLETAVLARPRVPQAVTDLLAAALHPPPLRSDDPAFPTLVHLAVRYLATAPKLGEGHGTLLLGQPLVLLQALHTLAMSPQTGSFAPFVPTSKGERTTANQRLVELAEHADTRSGPRWLGPAVLGGAGRSAQITALDVETLFSMGTDIGAIFVELLVGRGEPDRLVDTVAPAVRSRSRTVPHGTHTATMLRALFTVDPERFDPARRAIVDVWRLVLGEPSAAAATFTAAGYGESFGRELEYLGPEAHRGIAPVLAQRLMDGTDEVAFLGAGASAAVRPYYLELLRAVASELAPAAARQLAEALPPSWWDEAIRFPEFAWYRALDGLHRVVRDRAPLPMLLAAVDAALRNAGTGAEVAAELRPLVAESAAADTEELLSELYRSPDRGAAARGVALELMAALCTDACGVRAGDEFREHATRQRNWYHLLLRGGAENSEART
ncbi:hypothetical protein [Nocardia asteroides]|uniref:hypothetical protein n=1 Tax=Nocardia asteroides TaxID=1824 RepID=UPI001E46815A|nr:hypothetical protein [Nocardia asteroides]UGT62490.1 hypothetical protein LTT61_03840 [Nocardia asteroides]